MQPRLPVIPDCHGPAWQSPPGVLVWNQETPYYDHTFTGKPESSILAAVHSGRYATLDDAMTEAASLLSNGWNRNGRGEADSRQIAASPSL